MSAEGGKIQTFYFTQPPVLCKTEFTMNINIPNIKINGLSFLKGEFIFSVLGLVSSQQTAYQEVDWIIFE